MQAFLCIKKVLKKKIIYLRGKNLENPTLQNNISLSVGVFYIEIKNFLLQNAINAFYKLFYDILITKF